MICETCRYNDPPGFVWKAGVLEPCPDCGGTRVAHCCDGLTACDDPDAVFICSQMALDDADEERFQELADGILEALERDAIH
jgi:predicted metal-binding protein